MPNDEYQYQPQQKLPVGREHVECDGPGCSETGPPKMCSRCHMTFYCGVACQRAHWRNGHREDCRDINFFREHFAKSESKTEEVCENASGSGGKAEAALLYAARASRGDKSAEERKHYSELALAELARINTTAVNLRDPSETAQALFTKTEVLLQLERPADALRALEELEAIDKQGRENKARIESLLDSLEALEIQGRTSEADRVAQQLAEMREANMHTTRLPNCGFDLYIKMAECFEAMKEYRKAIDTYKFKIMDVIDYDDPDAMVTPPQQRMMFMGMSRCLYRLEKYDSAIHAGEAAVEMNRHFPQVHKYVALSQKATGDLRGAVQTMGRAVTYETPWDEANQNIVLEMYKELKNESLAADSGLVAPPDEQGQSKAGTL